MSTSAARCTICNHEVDNTEGLTGCPKCGTASLPCDPREDVVVKINWHELRILSIWAEMHANANETTSAPNTSMQQTVFSITRRLEAQHPKMETPLTLGGELRQLKQQFPTMETNVPYKEGFDPAVQEDSDAG